MQIAFLSNSIAAGHAMRCPHRMSLPGLVQARSRPFAMQKTKRKIVGVVYADVGLENKERDEEINEELISLSFFVDDCCGVPGVILELASFLL